MSIISIQYERVSDVKTINYPYNFKTGQLLNYFTIIDQLADLIT